MPNAYFLTKNRHGTKYFFRGTIPADLRRYFASGREFRIALNTSDRRVAKRKALALWAELQVRYDQLRTHIMGEKHNNSMTKSQHLRQMLDRVKHKISESENKTLRQELEWAQTDIKREKRRAAQTNELALTAMAKSNKAATMSVESPMPFYQVADEYMKKYAREGGTGKPPAHSTLTKKQEKVTFWAELYGERPIHEIGKVEIGKVQDEIHNLPSNSSKLYKTPADAMEAARNGHGHKVINQGKTVVDYQRALGDIFKHALQRGYIEQNHGVHLLEVKQHSENATKKLPFTDSDLKKIFPANYGLGFHKKGKPDPIKMSARFWVPLLSLFSGARVEELCQLKVDDLGVCPETNTPYYCITNEGEAHDGQAKRTKNKNSIRLVPIHRRLIDIGFLEFVEERRASEGKSAGLFALERREGERMGKQVSSWFSRMEKRTHRNGEVYYAKGYIERQGVQKSGEIGGKVWSKSLHTFRHTLINHLLNQKHPKTGEEFTVDQIDQLTGHKASESSVKTYTQDGLKVMKLRAAAITAAMSVNLDFLPLCVNR
tara:strand:+ start:121743 stop:123380 length:1638 start_codon:yes stop_codon:yes gene_type:complete